MPRSAASQGSGEGGHLKEPLGRNHAVGFALIAAGAGFVFSGRGS